MFLHSLLNVLVEIANKMGLQKRQTSKTIKLKLNVGLCYLIHSPCIIFSPFLKGKAVLRYKFEKYAKYMKKKRNKNVFLWPNV
jgi:hypothetical protein